MFLLNWYGAGLSDLLVNRTHNELAFVTFQKNLIWQLWYTGAHWHTQWHSCTGASCVCMRQSSTMYTLCNWKQSRVNPTDFKAMEFKPQTKSIVIVPGLCTQPSPYIRSNVAALYLKVFVRSMELNPGNTKNWPISPLTFFRIKFIIEDNKCHLRFYCKS